ncbi:MAG: DUF2628 domain-containing protein [Clostridium sp.]|uniref:DUF2628 domain-containing protein n=1 Tax=Clostridium sp. TaxID=1506 RepID=UPI003F35AA5D
MNEDLNAFDEKRKNVEDTIINPINNDSEASVPNHDLYSYIGYKNLDYYHSVFNKHKESDNFVSWNWCSFLFTPFWLLYRKLYIWFLIFFIAEFVLDSFSFMFPFIGSILRIGLMVLFGLFGNSMYLNSAKHRIRKINNSLQSYKHKDEILKATGGTNLVAPLILFGIIALFVLTIGFTVSSLFSGALSGILSQYNISIG